MKRLHELVKRRIVEHLACYLTATQVSAEIQSEFGVEVSPRHVRAYDPTSFQFVGAVRWIEYHDVVRRGFLEDMASIAISHRNVRLRRLDKILDLEIQRGNLAGARATLEQAAKEVGDLYNRAGAHRAEAESVQPQPYAPEEGRQILADRIAQALEKLGRVQPKNDNQD